MASMKRPDLVVKGHRNGGSSNIILIDILFGKSCERPPKWWFKQLEMMEVEEFESL